MNLLEIRQKFIVLSGRADLATTTTQTSDTDAGADFFIQAGTRFLDFQTQHDRQEAFQEEALAEGECQLLLKNCRTVKAVWFMDSAGAWAKLEHCPEEELREEYPDWNLSDTGTPAYWSQIIGRAAPSQVGGGQPVEQKLITVMPPTDAAITIRVLGIFHSFQLEENEDENFWSIEYPEALVFATLRALEASYRNLEGMRDWEVAMEPYLRGVSNDDAAFIGDEPSEMEG